MLQFQNQIKDGIIRVTIVARRKLPTGFVPDRYPVSYEKAGGSPQEMLKLAHKIWTEEGYLKVEAVGKPSVKRRIQSRLSQKARRLRRRGSE